MPGQTLLLMALAFVFGVAVCLLALHPQILFRRKHQRRPKTPRDAFAETCPVCRREFVLRKSEIRVVANVEMALAISAMPKLAGRKLGEHVCPHCESHVCFDLTDRRPLVAGANLYVPQGRSAYCLECRKPLQTPPWKKGRYDGRLHEAPKLLPDYGLVCSRCGAACCYDCCVKATRGRTKDGTLICPRCFRSPVDKAYYP